jgi:3-hydroxy-9,10-secoandrosta-1,3,5(10)-triene-9,17-dione monooxygenase
VFVPNHRIVPIHAIPDDTRDDDGTSQFQLPFAPVAAAAVAGPLLGLGAATLKTVIDKAPTKPLSHTLFSRQSDSTGVQIQIAQAAVRLRTAHLHAYDIIDALDDATQNRQLLTYAMRAEIRARVGYLAQQVLEALSILINAHGAGSFAESSRIQQYWRDANTAARHAGIQPVVGYEIYGKALLGIAERISAIV